MKPIYMLALNGYDGDKDDDFRMFRTRIYILKLLQLGHENGLKLDKNESFLNFGVVKNSGFIEA
jgi:hypothetical protein